jgi:hypothetical protein
MRAVVDAIVATFRAVDSTVATKTRRHRAVELTRAVGAIVGAIVARLGAIDLAVTAICHTARAVRRARAMCARVAPVVAQLVAIEFAVTAEARTVRGLKLTALRALQCSRVKTLARARLATQVEPLALFGGLENAIAAFDRVIEHTPARDV